MSKKKYDTISISIGKKGDRFRASFERFKVEHPEINISELFKNIILPIIEDLPESRRSRVNFAKSELKKLYKQRDGITLEIRKIEKALDELGVDGQHISATIMQEVNWDNLPEEQGIEI